MRMTLLARCFTLALLMAACAPLTPGKGTNADPGQVFISKSDLLIMESFPVQIAVSVSGEMPTPCHQLVTQVEQADENNRIEVTVSSRTESDEVCIQVLEPFSTQIAIDMQGVSDGVYSVWVNGEMIGEFSYPG